jgi:hypothetical protein
VCVVCVCLSARSVSDALCFVPMKWLMLNYDTLSSVRDLKTVVTEFVTLIDIHCSLFQVGALITICQMSKSPKEDFLPKGGHFWVFT